MEEGEMERSAQIKEGKITSTMFLGVPCLRHERGYFNISRIAIDKGHKDINRVTRNIYWGRFVKSVQELYLIDPMTGEVKPVGETEERFVPITDRNMSFNIINKGDYSGTYMPAIFLHFFISLIDGEYIANHSYSLIAMNKTILENDLTFDELTKLKPLRSSTISNGAILIHKLRTNVYKLKFKVITVDANDYPDDIVINDVSNVKTIERLISFYTESECVPGIQRIACNEYGGELEAIKALIESLRNNTFVPVFDIDKAINGFLKNNRVPDRQFFGFLFEFFCAKKYGLTPYKYEPTEQLGLPKGDTGVDLMSIDKKIIAQCKYYNRTTLDKTRLKTFIDYCKYFNDWKHVLYISDKTPITEEVKEATDEKMFEIIVVRDSEFNVFSGEILARFKDIEDDVPSTKSSDSKKRTLPAKTAVATKILTEINNNEISDLSLSLSSTFTELTNEAEESSEPLQPIVKTVVKRDVVRTDPVHLNRHINYMISEPVKARVREIVKEILARQDSILLRDLIPIINERLEIDMNQNVFLETFDGLYRKTKNGSVPRNRKGYPIIYQAIDRDMEIEWITETIGDGEYIASEFLTMHNQHFNVNYTMAAYNKAFGYLFEHQASRSNAFIQRSFDSQKKSIYRFELDDARIARFRTYIIEQQNAGTTTLVRLFNEHFHRYENSTSFGILMNTIFHGKPRTTQVSSTMKNYTDENIEEIRDLTKRTLAEKDIALEDMIELINRTIQLPNPVNEFIFTHACSGLYYINGDKMLPKNDEGRKMLYLPIDLEEQKDWIVNYFEEKEVDEVNRDELIRAVNEHFRGRYNNYSFTHAFKDILVARHTANKRCYISLKENDD